MYGQKILNLKIQVLCVTLYYRMISIPPFRRQLLSIFRFHADWIQPEQQDAGNFLPMDKASNHHIPEDFYLRLAMNTFPALMHEYLCWVLDLYTWWRDEHTKTEYTSSEKRTTALKMAISYRSFLRLQLLYNLR